MKKLVVMMAILLAATCFVGLTGGTHHNKIDPKGAYTGAPLIPAKAIVTGDSITIIITKYDNPVVYWDGTFKYDGHSKVVSVRNKNLQPSVLTNTGKTIEFTVGKDEIKFIEPNGSVVGFKKVETK